MKKTHSTNTLWHHASVTRQRRETLHQHKSIILWFTGLSGAGKSTIAHAVEEELHQKGCTTFVLDGDNVRHGLCGDLGFTDGDRQENIRRIGELSKLMMESGTIVLTAFISPFKADRGFARELIPHGEFLEVYCQCDLSVCEERDVKGLYKKARQGEIAHFTGISSPYEPPVNPELIINSDKEEIDDSVAKVVHLLKARGVFLNS